MFEKELTDLCTFLNKHSVEYLLIGGYAVNFHGYQRATVDIDIWYNPTDQNLSRLLTAIQDFGFEVPAQLKTSSLVEAFIRLPLDEIKIELMSAIDGKFSFEDAYEKAIDTLIGNVPIKIIGYHHLIQNKIMSRRPKDILDIQELEKRKKSRDS